MNQERILEELKYKMTKFLSNLEYKYDDELKNTYDLIINKILCNYNLRELGISDNDLYELKNIISDCFSGLNTNLLETSEQFLKNKYNLINRKVEEHEEEKSLLSGLSDEFEQVLQTFETNKFNEGISNINSELNYFMNKRLLNYEQKGILTKIVMKKCEESFQELFTNEKEYSKTNITRFTDEYIVQKQNIERIEQIDKSKANGTNENIISEKYNKELSSLFHEDSKNDMSEQHNKDFSSLFHEDNGNIKTDNRAQFIDEPQSINNQREKDEMLRQLFSTKSEEKISDNLSKLL